ncbi:MAG: pyridoxal-phosphate-dependent aminotransferase family protein [Candidatus Bipolaricaulia bacterium]
MTLKRYRLMIPGPVDVDPEVLAEMGAPVGVHYGPEWTAVYNETLDLLKRVFQTEGDVVLIVGSGSAGLDAAIGSVVGDGEKKALVLINGFFGERLLAITHAYTHRVQAATFDLDEPIAVEAVEEALRQEGDIAAVIAVHVETSTGVLNPIQELGALCKRYGALLIVDAVSSLGGVELDVDGWGVGICVGATQKCLEAPPGLSPVAVSEQAWELIEATHTPGWYLNLRTWKEYSKRWVDWHPHPVTVSTNTTLALKRSLERILDEGLEMRFDRHKWATSFLRQGMRNLGFKPFVEDDRHAAPTVTAVRVDERISAARLIQFLKERHRISISGGIEDLRGSIFRVGHMGPGATSEAILPLLFAIEEELREAGADLPVGQSLYGIENKME